MKIPTYIHTSTITHKHKKPTAGVNAVYTYVNTYVHTYRHTQIRIPLHTRTKRKQLAYAFVIATFMCVRECIYIYIYIYTRHLPH